MSLPAGASARRRAREILLISHEAHLSESAEGRALDQSCSISSSFSFSSWCRLPKSAAAAAASARVVSSLAPRGRHSSFFIERCARPGEARAQARAQMRPPLARATATTFLPSPVHSFIHSCRPSKSILAAERCASTKMKIPNLAHQADERRPLSTDQTNPLSPQSNVNPLTQKPSSK